MKVVMQHEALLHGIREDNYFDETPLGTIALASEDTGMTYTLQWDISYDSKVFPVMTVAADFFH